jgi:hypothetical protein
MLDWSSRLVRLSLVAWIRPPSLPEMPIAVPPTALTALTICLLIAPESTISTISTVAASVTRRPSTNSLFTDSRSSILPICGPPPCTTTGWTPTCFSSTMSRAKRFESSASPMAWPPYLITKVLPA